MNILYQHFGLPAISIAIASSLGWWLYWYPPKWLSRRIEKFRTGSVTSAEGILASVPTTWISRSEALTTLGRSSSVRLRVDTDPITSGQALSAILGLPLKETPEQCRARELQRKMLRDFEAEHPGGVRDDQYGKELLEWWIDEQSEQSNP